MTAMWTFGMIRGPSAPTGRRLVVKLGGSLLARPQWPVEIAGLVADLPRPCVLIVGGGAVVDGLRVIDAAVPRPPRLMHRLAIEAMRLTAAVVAEAVALTVVTTADDAHAAAILDVAAWLETHAAATRMPENWTVTSDSLAAVVAATVAADLLLVKSVSPPAATYDLEALAATGWVDAAFPTVAQAVATIRWAAPAAEAVTP
jgi:aspartokinase-like uncharacterized kinase